MQCRGHLGLRPAKTCRWQQAADEEHYSPRPPLHCCLYLGSVACGVRVCVRECANTCVCCVFLLVCAQRISWFLSLLSFSHLYLSQSPQRSTDAGCVCVYVCERARTRVRVSVYAPGVAAGGAAAAAVAVVGCVDAVDVAGAVAVKDPAAAPPRNIRARAYANTKPSAHTCLSILEHTSRQKSKKATTRSPTSS